MTRKWYVLGLTGLVILCAYGEAQAQPSRPDPKVVDKKFWLLTGATTGTGIADSAQHFKCRRDHPPVPEGRSGDLFYGPHPGCQEGNPLLGPYPSPQRSIATGAAFHAGAAWAGYELKKRRKWYWWAPQAALIGAHVYGIVNSRKRYPKWPPQP